MDWTRLLEAAGIPDSPGRAEAVEKAQQLTKSKPVKKKKKR